MQVLGRQQNAFNKHTAKPAMQISGAVITALVRDNYPRSLLPHYDEKINGGLILGWRTINVGAKAGLKRCMFATIFQILFLVVRYREPDRPILPGGGVTGN
ncbi:MAG: hypothetical protein WAN60_16065 [Candidatus Sulfotelmatobacter sp.]